VAKAYSLDQVALPSMKRTRKFLLVVSGVLALVIVIGAILFFRSPDDGRTPLERRQVADACLVMLRSSLTNEVEDIKPDDSRVPEVIRALHPVDIQLQVNEAVVMCAGKPAEYHLSRRPGGAKTWILYVAGPGYLGHKEILRMKHD
jgi:hypothetical protein